MISLSLFSPHQTSIQRVVSKNQWIKTEKQEKLSLSVTMTAILDAEDDFEWSAFWQKKKVSFRNPQTESARCGRRRTTKKKSIFFAVLFVVATFYFEEKRSLLSKDLEKQAASSSDKKLPDREDSVSLVIRGLVERTRFLSEEWKKETEKVTGAVYWLPWSLFHSFLTLDNFCSAYHLEKVWSREWVKNCDSCKFTLWQVSKTRTSRVSSSLGWRRDYYKNLLASFFSFHREQWRNLLSPFLPSLDPSWFNWLGPVSSALTKTEFLRSLSQFERLKVWIGTSPCTECISERMNENESLLSLPQVRKKKIGSNINLSHPYNARSSFFIQDEQSFDFMSFSSPFSKSWEEIFVREREERRWGRVENVVGNQRKISGEWIEREEGYITRTSLVSLFQVSLNKSPRMRWWRWGEKRWTRMKPAVRWVLLSSTWYIRNLVHTDPWTGHFMDEGWFSLSNCWIAKERELDGRDALSHDPTTRNRNNKPHPSLSSFNFSNVHDF